MERPIGIYSSSLSRRDLARRRARLRRPFLLGRLWKWPSLVFVAGLAALVAVRLVG
jgi:hypothetical protein